MYTLRPKDIVEKTFFLKRKNFNRQFRLGAWSLWFPLNTPLILSNKNSNIPGRRLSAKVDHL